MHGAFLYYRDAAVLLLPSILGYLGASHLLFFFLLLAHLY